VVVVVMVQSQQELLKVSHGGQRVNSENSMQAIGIADARVSPQSHRVTEKKTQKEFPVPLCPCGEQVYSFS
jgi:hypothetical protein